MYGGSKLTVNGGSFENNSVDGNDEAMYYGGAVCVIYSTATFNNVVFKNNWCKHRGAAIYADDSDVTIKNCTFDGNEAKYAIFHGEESSYSVSDSTIINNKGQDLFALEYSALTISSSEFKNNDHYDIISTNYNNTVQVTNSTFTDNDACIINANSYGISKGSYAKNCTFDRNTHKDFYNDIYGEPSGSFSGNFANMEFRNCDFGNSNLKYAENLNINYTDLSTDEVVISVTVLTNLGAIEQFGFKFFDYGWNYAMEALDRSDMITGITVDLYKDWNAVNGVFGTSGDGFSGNTIFVPAGKPVTLNMNGHTINRGLTEVREDGEVIYVASGADLTINNGTITGGFSNNGAGGIHISSDAKVTLNDVHVDGNTVQNDDGGAIAVYDDATLTMNGGSLSNNKLTESLSFRGISYGVLYLEDANASLSGVDISNNKYIGPSYPYGLAVYMTDSTLSMKDCTLIKNNDESADVSGGMLILSEGSSSILDVDNCKFDDNGTAVFNGFDLIYIRSGTLRMKNSICNFNGCRYVIFNEDGNTEVTNSTFTDNTRGVFGGDGKAIGSFTDCTFSGNTVSKEYYHTFYLDTSSQINFNTCDFGDATFNDRSLAIIDGAVGAGSIFGEGSLTMIVAILALVASAVSIFLIVDMKKKLVPHCEEEEN